MRERTLRIGAMVGVFGLVVGCGSTGGESTGASATGVTSATQGTTGVTGVTGVTSVTEGTGGTDSGTGTGEPTTSGSSGALPKLDVGSFDFGTTPGDKGCEKVDFLFVVDNSGSMEDEQQNLVNSFPGFISTIQNTLMAKDYHILVTDTDAAALSFGSNLTCINGVCTCKPEPQCCIGLCHGGFVNPPPADCAGVPCADWEVPMGCDAALGGGKVSDPVGNPCGVDSGKRYMLDSQQDLSGTFSCVAKVGAGGDGNELPMDAMREALGPLNQAGQCNDGFLRPDAILVVTFITDEEDEDKSMGDPAAWKQALVDLKGGNEEAVVVLGLVGDPDVPGGICDDGADASPRLRTFAESFTHGQWGSVCAPDYAPFFADAVSVIDTACDDFIPPG